MITAGMMDNDGVTNFDQRMRDAKTILQAHWPPAQPPLPDDVQDTVATIMVIYAIQIELGGER